MHAYYAHAPQEQDLILEPLNRHSDRQNAPHKTTDHSHSSPVRPSFEFSSGHLCDNASAIIDSSATRSVKASALPSSDVTPLNSTEESFPTPDPSIAPTHGGPNQGSMQRLLSVFSQWKPSRRLQTAIIGLPFLSLHCGFFVYLDGRILSNDPKLFTKKTTIPQGYVTTVSLLITTAFRAALLAGVGVCYTQHLWATLRERVLKVCFVAPSYVAQADVIQAGLIEDLFQIQANPFHFTRSHLYTETPVLAAVAAFCWLVPIATVYPPGALVVELGNITSATRFNVSVLNVKDPLKDLQYTSHIWCSEDGTGPIDIMVNGNQMQNYSFLQTCVSRQMSHQGEGRTSLQDTLFFDYNKGDAPYVTRSTLMSGEIVKPNQPAEGNVSYTLEFWGTTLRCQAANSTIERLVREPDVNWIRDIVFNVTAIEVPYFVWLSGIRSIWDPSLILDNTTITHRFVRFERGNFWRYYPCLETTDSTDGIHFNEHLVLPQNWPEPGVTFLIPITETVCRPSISKYSVAVKYHAGYQDVSVSTLSDATIPPYHGKFAKFSGSFEQWVKFSDALRVYDEFAYNLAQSPQYFYNESFDHGAPVGYGDPYVLKNGSSSETCLIAGRQNYGVNTTGPESPIWPLSVFERRLVPKGHEQYYPNINRTLFNSEMANTLLINSTINMLALNKHFDMVDGTISRAFNVYRFRNRLSFFLPYALSLGLSLPIILLGLNAFHIRNQGVSAITGGFFQILMTTRGRGMLDEIVVKGSGTMGGLENVSEELKELKIRFGELIEADVVEHRSGLSRCDPRIQEEHADVLDTVQLVEGHADVGANEASGVDHSEKRKAISKRAGFGVAEEVRSFKKSATQA